MVPDRPLPLPEALSLACKDAQDLIYAFDQLSDIAPDSPELQRLISSWRASMYAIYDSARTEICLELERIK
jgi:hypothetical protein